MSHGTRPKPLRGSDARTKPSASTSSGEVRAGLRAGGGWAGHSGQPDVMTEALRRWVSEGGASRPGD